MDKQHELILWGATSFVGQIASKYLMQTYGVNQNLNWAPGVAGYT